MGFWVGPPGITKNLVNQWPNMD